MGMTSMNVSLPEDLKEYAEAQTKYGYSTPSEYIRELIRDQTAGFRHCRIAKVGDARQARIDGGNDLLVLINQRR